VPKPPPRPWRHAAFSFSKDKPDAEEKRREAEVSRGLEAIYLTNGKKQDFNKFSHTKRSKALRIFSGFVGCCALASGLAWAGLFFFGAPGPAEASGVIVAIDGSEAIGLGREESFTIRWSNPSMQPEQEVELRFSMPGEMLVSSLVPPPDDAEHFVWRLGMLQPGAKGEIKLKGVFLGTLGSKSALQAVATSRGSNGGRPREALVTKPLIYNETVLAGLFHVPTKVVAGDPVTIRYDVANRGSQGLRGLKVRLKIPEGFVPSATSTGFQRLGSTLEWEAPLGDLPAGTTTTLRMAGIFAAQSSGDVKTEARIGAGRPDRSFLPLLVGESTFTVLAGDLGLKLVANGSDQDRTMAPGDPLRITIQYKNLSPEKLSAVKLVLGFESLADGKSATGTSWLAWRDLEDEGRGVSTTKTRIQTIRYDQTTSPVFAQLLPQEEGTIDIEIPTLFASSSTKDAAIRLTLEGSMATVGNDRSTRLIRTAPLTFRYRSDAQLEAEARYFTEEGAPIGVGPLPPVAGKTTSYRLFWTLKKALHPLENVQVSAVLPASVVWGATSSTEAGVLSYDEKTRAVTWSLNLMPEEVDEVQSSFEVQLTPTEFDAGRFAQLLGESKLTANDPTVSEAVIRSLPPITTDLENDDGARNKGVVKKSQ
jgi:hypothetical protein